ncbi:murein L,D-transpeptidase [Desulfoprunum benzoelyticum]|uniref:Murein L,D-transpeptidase YafK n=1 Tax=Desulfoprunum benzoelyticum TaxID=1506996 RepID=A0A840UND9_9BACT|nr:murein L,D-transpeptidase family protein [Desulfoprunum benzoelyticum]MBB5346346.1 murein L,D-transpeptidase YafK [Desulfoprunum benzoelyticum]MBM9528655.1 murein L,D-transpeptidase [Desulfoprunum benzoelyticum]
MKPSICCGVLILTIIINTRICHSDTIVETPASETSLEVVTRMAPEIAQAMAKKALHLGAPIFMRIFKESDELEIWVLRDNGFVHFKTYTICDYSGGLGPKEKEGDKQSPEGFYRVGPAQLNPWSRFHLAFNLGYPNDYDRCNGRTGNALMVHGRCSSIGCFAMTDYRMEEIYTIADAALANGQESFAVHIFPFRMTAENMRRHHDGRWQRFWGNLKEGYDIFERTATPPEVTVNRDRYIFKATTIELARQP